MYFYFQRHFEVCFKVGFTQRKRQFLTINPARKKGLIKIAHSFKTAKPLMGRRKKKNN
jgi:hypothetical protein